MGSVFILSVFMICPLVKSGRTDGLGLSQMSYVNIFLCRTKFSHIGLDIECSPGSSVHAPFRARITHRDDYSITMQGIYTFIGMLRSQTNADETLECLAYSCKVI